MQITAFTEFKTGRLVPIRIGDRSDDWAFVPNPLPPSWTLPERLWPLIAEARARLGRLDGISTALPDPTLLLRPLQRREALSSNSLEGTFVTPRELLLFEAEQNLAKPPEQDRADDWREVANYDRAMTYGCQAIKEGRSVGATLLCELHRMLLASVRGRDKSPGVFRDSQVYVGTDRRYIPPPASELAACLSDLESYWSSSRQTDSLVRAYVAHYQFEAIHPFHDGNGRLGRLLLSLLIYKWTNLSQPCLYMSEFFERNRQDYIAKLFAVSTNGEWAEWIEFCLQGTIEQAESSIERCEALRALKAKYRQEVGPLGPRMHNLVDKLFSSPIVTITEIERTFGVTYHTARSDVERLVVAGVLTEMKNRRPRAFCATEIFRIAYGTPESA